MADTTTQSAVLACPSCGTVNRVNLARLADGPRCGGCRKPLDLARPLKATAADFDQSIRGSTVPVLVDFYADWCGPCRMVAPMMEDLARRMAGDILVLKVDTDAWPAVNQRFGIRGIPTLIAFRNGAESGRIVGVPQPQALAALVQKA
ncbi:MAG: thioredoxin [Gemmatimonadota bacterium]